MKKAIIITVGVVVLGAILYLILNPKSKAGTEVYVAEVKSGEVISIVSANGEIQPRTKVNISSNIRGEIIALPVKEGDRVRKGQELVKIDQEPYIQDVRRLEASARMARIAVERELTRNRTLEVQLRRAEALREEGILPEESYEDTRLSYDSSIIQLKSLEESVSQATAALDKAQDELRKTVIYAPMAGTITQLNTEVGEQVIVGTTNVPGSVIMVISDMSEILAETDVDETEVVSVRVGQSAKVSVDAVEDKEYRGRVNEIRNSARRKQDVNVFGVKVLIEDPDERLRPGMSARARIEIERREGVLRVPIQAVLERDVKDVEEQIAKAEGKEKRRGKDRVRTEQKPDDDAGAPTTGAAVAASMEKGESGEGPAGGGGDTDLPPAGGDESEGEEAEDEDGAEDEKGDAGETVDVVYVVRDGKARIVRVTTGLADDTNVEVLSGLEDGDRVITGPYRALRKLKQGDQVHEKDEDVAKADEDEQEEEEQEE